LKREDNSISSRILAETCGHCGRPRLPNCRSGTQEHGPCCFTRCDNLRAVDAEVLEATRKKGALTEWVRGPEMGLLKGKAVLVLAMGRNGLDWAVTTSKGAVRTVRKSSLEILK
jgi:hypothetical protein